MRHCDICGAKHPAALAASKNPTVIRRVPVRGKTVETEMRVRLVDRQDVCLDCLAAAMAAAGTELKMSAVQRKALQKWRAERDAERHPELISEESAS